MSGRVPFKDLDTERILVSSLRVSDSVIFVRYGYVDVIRVVMEIVNFHRSVKVIFDDGREFYWEKLSMVDILVVKR